MATSTYPLNTTTYKALSLNDICNRGSVLIVGGRGCGKTTIAHNIVRTYKPKYAIVHDPTVFSLRKMQKSNPDLYIESMTDCLGITSLCKTKYLLNELNENLFKSACVFDEFSFQENRHKLMNYRRIISQEKTYKHLTVATNYGLCGMRDMLMEFPTILLGKGIELTFKVYKRLKNFIPNCWTLKDFEYVYTCVTNEKNRFLVVTYTGDVYYYQNLEECAKTGETGDTDTLKEAEEHKCEATDDRDDSHLIHDDDGDEYEDEDGTLIHDDDDAFGCGGGGGPAYFPYNSKA